MHTDIEDEIRAAMARAAAQAPPADALAARAVARVRRRRWATGAGALLAAAGVALGAVAIRSPEPRDDTAAVPVDEFALPSSGWSEGEGGHLALLTGTLEANDRCLYARHGDLLMALLWPEGWTARAEDDGVQVIDHEGRPVLREGDAFQVAGGTGDSGDVCGVGEGSTFAMHSNPVVEPR